MKPDYRPSSPKWAMGCLVLLLAACGPSQEPPAEAAAAEPANDAAITGQDLFDKNCGACHGAGGRGPSLETLKALNREELGAAIRNHPTAGQIPSRLPANEIGNLIEFLDE